jgi:predicted transcriptional regulator
MLTAERYIGCLRTIRHSASDMLNADRASAVAGDSERTQAVTEAITGLRIHLNKVELSAIETSGRIPAKNAYKIVRRCLDRMVEVYPISISDVSDVHYSDVSSIKQLRVEGRNIVIPLGYDGVNSQNWVPLFESVISNLSEINTDLHAIERRVIADGNPELSKDITRFRERLIEIKHFQQNRLDQFLRINNIEQALLEIKNE